MKTHRRIQGIIVLSIVLFFSFIVVALALDSTVPTITVNGPAENSTVNSSNATVSFIVSDTDDQIQNANYFIKVNGTTVTSTLQYQGHFVDDGCGNSTYVIDSNKQATVSASVTGLKDGVQTVAVQAMDQSGNIAAKTWTFTVSTKPTFSAPSPADGTSTANNKSFSVKVSDNNGIDPKSIAVNLDNVQVAATFDATTGTITGQPATVLSDGTHKVNVSAANTVGHVSTFAWSFTVQTAGPTLTFAGDGQTFNIYNPIISVNLKSNVKLNDTSAVMTIDGQPMTATFSYTGHWDYPFEQDPVWIVDSNNAGTLTYTPASLKDGSHIISVTAKDILNNASTQSWTFTVSTKPTFSSPSPANGGSTANANSFSIKVADNNGIDSKSFTVSLDNVQVPSTFDATTGIITGQPTAVMTDGTHSANISVSNTAGHVATFAWSFTVQTAGPTLTFAGDGQTFNIYNPTISVSLKSNVKLIDTSAVMTIDGKSVTTTFTYSGHFVSDYCGTTYVIDSYNGGTITYTPTSITDGSHVLTVTAKDIVNNTSTQSWHFSIAQIPLFSAVSPQNGTVVNTQTPAINVTVTDPNGPGLDKSSVKLLVDNQPVVPTLTVLNGAIVVCHTPTLANDKYHNISLTVAKTDGISNTLNWKFYVNTRGEMPVDVQSCGSCHTLNENNKHVHSTMGPYGYRVGDGHPPADGSCGHCHSGYDPKFCGYCHNGDPDAIFYGTAVPDPTLDAGQDCTSCHSPKNSGISVQNIVNTGIDPVTLPANSKGVVVHDILPLHQVDKGSCNSCHSTYLTREHNRKDKNGVQLTCATCHKCTDPNVQKAIASKNPDCLACHTQADHAAVHTSSLDPKCQTCHSAVLSKEHTNNPTTAGKNFTCDTCHANTRNDVQRTIAAGDLNCAGCHKQGHNMNFSDQVPADIPFYAGYQWTTPQEANIFAKEPSTPPGYATGQVVMSDRQDIKISDVWNFYNTQLLANGWTLKSGTPAATATYFAAEFQKDKRFVIVRCYDTALGDGTGAQISGYRIEIWYK